MSKNKNNDNLVDGYLKQFSSKQQMSKEEKLLLFKQGLQNLYLQNVKKSKSKTYSQYTKEKIQSYIKNPLSNLDNIRDVSNFLWRVSMPYKKIIEYYSTIPLYAYNVVYNSGDWSKPLNTKDFLSKYSEVASRLENMDLQQLSPSIIATALRDGIYSGFVYDDGNSFMIMPLDPKYCKISAITDRNTYTLKFDAQFFDQGNNKEYVLGADDDELSQSALWDKVFIDGYNTYKSQGRDYQWFDLPVERTITVIAGDDPEIPLPYFLPIFVSLLDLLDYESLIRSKTELQNTVLLLSKIPLLTKENEPDAFAVGIEYVQLMQQLIDDVVPDLVGTAYSACDVEPIFFNNTNQVQDTNIYTEAIHNLFSNIGLSEMLFNGDKSGSVGLKHSIQVDTEFSMRLLRRFGANIQRYISLNINDSFSFYFHESSIFNLQDYSGRLKDKATLGIGKLDYATCDGTTPYRLMNSTYMENALGLTELWIPLSSSYTQSGSSTDGTKPEQDVDDLSDEGLRTREGNKNGTE